jgi:hypothetical protein
MESLKSGKMGGKKLNEAIDKGPVSQNILTNVPSKLCAGAQ